MSQIAVLIPLADTQNVKVGRCDPLFLLGIMYPQKVLHRLGDLLRCIEVLLNRFGAGFRVLDNTLQGRWREAPISDHFDHFPHEYIGVLFCIFS